MSLTEITFLTEDNYRAYRERQDNDIRRQFAQQASLIEEGNRQLAATFNGQISQLTTTFNSKLSNVNGTLGGKIGELSNEIGKVKKDVQLLKDEVSQVKDEVSQVKDEVSQVKDGLASLQIRLERMEIVRRNGTKTRLYEKIEMYGKISPSAGYLTPSYIPKDAGEFWNLKLNLTEVNIHRLIYLVKFYEIDDYLHWQRTYLEEHTTTDSEEADSEDIQSDDEQSSSESVLSALSLEDAVRAYPSLALEKIGTALGLNEENFERALRYQQRSRRVKKRPQSLQRAQAGGDVKRKKLPLRPSPEVQKPALALSQLMLDPTAESPKSDQTKLGYDDSSSVQRARAKVISKLHGGPQPGTPSTEYPGSPTEPNESPRIYEAANRSEQGKPNSQGSRKSGRSAGRV